MILFLAGILLFFGIHILSLLPSIRELLVSRISLPVYMGLYSIVSLAGLVCIATGYDSNSMPIYATIGWFHTYSVYAMGGAFFFVTAAYLPCYVRTIVLHPMSIGVSIWAISHLLLNSDWMSVVLFGSFLLYALASVLKQGKNIKIKMSANILYDGLAVIIAMFGTYGVYNYHDLFFGVSVS